MCRVLILKTVEHDARGSSGLNDDEFSLKTSMLSYNL